MPTLTTINWFSSIGLILDIIGVYLLYRHGLPSKVSEGDGHLWEESPEEEKTRTKSNAKIKFWAKTGLLLIISGFVLQLIGSNI